MQEDNDRIVLDWLEHKKIQKKEKKPVVKLDLKEHSSSSRQIYARTLYWLMPILCSAGSGYLAYHTYIFVAFMAYDFSVKNIKKVSSKLQTMFIK